MTYVTTSMTRQDIVQQIHYYTTHTGVGIFGRNNDLDIGTEDVWVVGGTWSRPSTARCLSFVSTSASDAAGQAGARTVEVYGLASDWSFQEETITLTGTSPVLTANKYIRFNRAHVITAGSRGTNKGAVSITQNTDSTAQGLILADTCHTFLGRYSVQNDVSGVIPHYYCAIQGSTNAQVDFYMWIKQNGNAKHLVHFITLSTAGQYVHHDFEIMPCVPPETDIWISATSNTNNIDIAAGFAFVGATNMDTFEIA